jgi:hypothetical protein
MHTLCVHCTHGLRAPVHGSGARAGQEQGAAAKTGTELRIGSAAAARARRQQSGGAVVALPAEAVHACYNLDPPISPF